MGKIISVFSHKGGVGKTTFVHNLAYVLSSRKKQNGSHYKVLLIDADPQTNLTAALLGKGEDFDYQITKTKRNRNQNEKNLEVKESVKKFFTDWGDFYEKYRTFHEHISDYVNAIDRSDKESLHKKPIYSANFKGTDFPITLLAGHVDIAVSEADWYRIIDSNTQVRDPRPYAFRRAIEDFRSDYDFVLIDTPPSASSIINALCINCSDYYLCPVVPNFFSFQSINNLKNIISDWSEMLKKHEGDDYARRGLRLNSKFIGVIVNRSKKYNNGLNQYSIMARHWADLINQRLEIFLDYAIRERRSINENDFSKIFENAAPFIIEHVAQFPDRVALNCEKSGVPMLMAKDRISFSKENSDTFKLIEQSYKFIADSFIKLLGL